MGIWAFTIFGSDITADLSIDFEDLIKSGYTSEEAASEILKTSYYCNTDEYYAELIHLALASLQLKTGNVSSEIANKALQIINGGRRVISDPYESKRRDKEYEELKVQLLKYKILKESK